MNRQVTASLAFVIGLVLTVLASLEVKQTIEQDATEEFAFASDQVTLKIKERLDAHALTLKGGAGLIGASSTVDRREWKAYVEKLRAQDSIPGVQGIGFSQVIPAQQLAAHIAKVRAEGFPDYTVRPAGERALYTSIIYLEPFRDRNLRAFGFDMFSEPVRRAAMEQARDSGAPALSGKVELVQETGKEVQAGTLMYVPVYRNGAQVETVEQRRAALIGWSYSPYRMKDLLEGILVHWDESKTRRVHLHVYAGAEVKADNLLYDSRPDRAQKVDPLFYQQRTIDFNGQHWLLAFRAGEGVAPVSYASAWATLAGGIMVSSLLCALMLALARTQARAKVIADTLTEDLKRSGDLLRESEARLTSLLDETKVHLWVFDGTTYKFFNKQWYDFTGQSPAEGMTIETWTSVVHPDDLPKATEIWLRHWATKTEHDNYFRLRRHDGVYRDFFCHTLPLFDEYGVFQAFQGFNLDITERKQAEEDLRQSEERYRAIADHSPVGIFQTDMQGDCTYVNPRWTEITGLSFDEALGKGWSQALHPDDKQRVFDDWYAAAIAGLPYDWESSFVTKQGKQSWITGHAEVLFDQHGNSQGYIGVIVDITQRKRAEAALQASENRFRNLLANIPTVAVQGYDENGITRYWNQASERLYGYPADEAIGRNLLDLIIPAEMHDGVREAIREMFETAVPIPAGELPLRRKDGSRVDVFSSHAFVHVPGRSPEMFCVDIDISERKRTEDALRRGEERIRNMSDAAGAYLWEIDTNMVYTYVSGQAMLVKGHQPEALLGHTPMDFMPSEDIAPVAEIVNRAIAEKSPFRLQHRDITPSGEVWWEEVYGAVFCDAEGKVIGLHGTGMGINARKQAENALRHEKQFTVDTLNALPGVFYMFDATGRFVRWNHQFSKVTGYTDTELATMQATDFFAGDDQRRVYETVQRVFDEGQADVEADFQTKDGQKLPYHFTGQSSTIGEQTYLLGVGIDVSEQRRVQQALEIERTHLHTLVRTIPDLIWLKDADGIYLACNPEFERFFGAAERDILGKTDYDFVSKDQADFFREHDLATIAAGEATCNEEWITYASDGRRILLETTKTPMRTPEGRLVGILGVGHDITERNAHQQQLEHIAHFDNLTGLPNRVLLADRLHQAMTQTLRRKTMLAVTFLDLDGFKAINDIYGHEAGDYLLTTLSGHMKRALREGDTLARIGGDEFVAILLDLPDIESCLPMISRLLAAAAEGVDFEGNTLRVSASLGATFYPQAEAIDADQLMRQADQAMYKAKQSGKNRYHIFDIEHDRSVRSHHESLDRIKQAMDQREFVLYYQPKVNMRTGVVIGTEALIRWQHPERGLLAPAAFLPIIADHPLAIEIGEWVLDTAMTQIETWKAAGLPLPVSVNIDATHLGQTNFVDHLRQQLLAHPALSAGDLELEVLETSALHDIAHVSSVILACREMGVGFALDDFGTGYSSLTYLKHLPASLLKIDQSFVRDMLDDPDDLSILNGVLGLSIAFRRQAIAEGVETLEHGEILLQLGCELAQGYAIARPMPAEDMPVWLAAWRPDPTWLNRAPISRNDLPILIAWVEHRAWILKVGKYIRGVGDTLPPMNHEQCRVGQWLKDEVRLPKENHLAIESLGPLHIEIHELASELIRLKQDGQMEVAIARLPELYRLRDCLLAKFMAILR